MVLLFSQRPTDTSLLYGKQNFKQIAYTKLIIKNGNNLPITHTHTHTHTHTFNQCIGLVGRVFANGPGDWGSIPG